MDRRSQVKEEEEKDVVGPLEMMMMMKRKKVVGMEKSKSTKCCQIERCSADMGDAKPYHRRHKVCEAHAKAEFVLLAGTRQRFCQQCSRFHELSEFDDSKRSCRWRLAGHNERRRKSTNPPESNSGQKMARNSQLTDKNPLCGGKADAKEKGHIKYPGKGQLQALCPD